MLSAHAQDIPEPITVPITVSVEVLDQAKVCNKAVAILVARHKITPAAARELLLIRGDLELRPEKCLELIFTSLSSPKNGYKVHTVTSDD